MRVLGLVFAGIEADEPPALASFLADVLGVEPREDDGAFHFALDGGDALAVVPRTRLPHGRDTILGFLVDDVEAAAAEVAARGVEPTGPLLTSGAFRYRHFRAPDGRLFELVERLPAGG